MYKNKYNALYTYVKKILSGSDTKKKNECVTIYMTIRKTSMTGIRRRIPHVASSHDFSNQTNNHDHKDTKKLFLVLSTILRLFRINVEPNT
jgi:hypothetical protein